MAIIRTKWWNLLEEWRAVAFLVGGVIFVADVALVGSHLASGTEPAAFGQVLVGTAWTASFIGLLGMYPSLRDRSRWLARIGAICAVIGGVTMAVMALTFLGDVTNVLTSSPSEVVTLLFPEYSSELSLGSDRSAS